MTNQPNFKCVANLGDVTPWDYGGAFVLVDQTGVYTPELRVFEKPIGTMYDEYTILLEKCTYINGVLSDNKYHPDTPAWFAKALVGTAEATGISELDLINWFCSSEILERAWAYLTVYLYHGPQGFPTYHFHKMAVMSRMKKWLREAAQYETA